MVSNSNESKLHQCLSNNFQTYCHFIWFLQKETPEVLYKPIKNLSVYPVSTSGRALQLKIFTWTPSGWHKYHSWTPNLRGTEISGPSATVKHLRLTVCKRTRYVAPDEPEHVDAASASQLDCSTLMVFSHLQMLHVSCRCFSFQADFQQWSLHRINNREITAPPMLGSLPEMVPAANPAGRLPYKTNTKGLVNQWNL